MMLALIVLQNAGKLVTEKPEWVQSLIIFGVVVSAILSVLTLIRVIMALGKKDAESEQMKKDIDDLKKKSNLKGEQDHKYTERLTVLETELKGVKDEQRQSRADQKEMLKILHKILGKLEG